MGCGASAPAPDVVEAEQAVRTHLQHIGLREEVAAQRATDLVDAGYDTPEQFDRLGDEQLERVGFRPGDLEKVATFRANGPPILVTAVGEEPATEAADEVRTPERSTLNFITIGKGIRLPLTH